MYVIFKNVIQSRIHQDVYLINEYNALVIHQLCIFKNDYRSRIRVHQLCYMCQILM